MSLLAELQRRNVFRVGLAYAMAAWVVLQVADLAFDTMELPGRALGYVWLALFVGFPVALIFGWRYDVTADGIVRTPESDADDSVDLSLRGTDFVILGTLAAVLLATGYQLFSRVGQIDPDLPVIEVQDVPPNSLAVLPFVNMSADPEQEYFSDGLSEELLNGLAQVEGLRVAGRTSSFHFKGVNEDMRTIGQKLGVRHLLEGSVRKLGQRIRVTAQLINAADGFHLWSDTYDYEEEDLFRVQDEISLAVVQAMQVELLGKDLDELVRRRTVNFAAHKLYLRGREYLHERTQESLGLAREAFQQAINEDPSYALPYSGLSDSVLLLSGNHGVILLDDALERGRALTERALALDDSSAEVWASLGLVELSAGDEAAAAAALEKAIALNPSYTTAYLWYAEVLETEDRIETLERVLAMDPLNREARATLVNELKRLGRSEAAVEQARKAVLLDPDYDQMYQLLFVLYHNYLYRHDEALMWVRKGHEMWPDEVLHMMSFVYAYMTLRMDDEAERWAEHLQERFPDHMFVAALPAILALHRQETESVMALVRQVEDSGGLRHNAVVRRIVGRMLVWALILDGKPEEGLGFLVEYFPEIFGPDPEVREWASRLAAYLLVETGRPEEATPILDALRDYATRLPGGQPAHGETILAHISMCEDDYHGFIEHMNKALDHGWLHVVGEYWALDDYPPTRRWVGRPEFDALANRISAGIEEQRQNVLGQRIAQQVVPQGPSNQ